MSKFVKLKKLFEAGIFVGDCTANYLIMNCANLSGSTPKKVWIKRDSDCCGNTGIQYTTTFVDPSNADALVGMWIEQTDGSGVIVDATDVDNILAACESCCDAEQVAITTTYTDEDGVPTIPAMTAATVNSYCVTRADDGSGSALNKFQLDYYGRIKSAAQFSASGTSTKYNVKSTVAPVLIGSDTKTNAVCS